jgi:hypothetical protein
MDVRYLPHGEDFDAIGTLPKLALIQMRGDDGWGELDTDAEDWADPNPVVLPRQPDTASSKDTSTPQSNGSRSVDPNSKEAEPKASERKQKSVEVVSRAIEQVEQVSSDENLGDMGMAVVCCWSPYSDVL